MLSKTVSNTDIYHIIRQAKNRFATRIYGIRGNTVFLEKPKYTVGEFLHHVSLTDQCIHELNFIHHVMRKELFEDVGIFLDDSRPEDIGFLADGTLVLWNFDKAEPAVLQYLNDVGVSNLRLDLPLVRNVVEMQQIVVFAID